MSEKPRIYVNVNVSPENAARIEREEKTWTGPRLVALTFGTLLVAFTVLYLMAQTTSQTTWSDWLFPG